MQSLLQYRRLRREVEEDLLRLQPAVTQSDTSKDKSDLEKPAQPRRLANDKPIVPGVTVSRPDETDGSVVFVVGWRDEDPSNPQNWSLTRKWSAIFTTCILTIALIIPTSVEGPTQNAFNAYYGVNALAGSMTTGIFLIGIGVGSLFSGPFSETFGRNAIYFSTMIVVMLFIMAKALAPNYGAAIAFRFLSALFAAAPMTVQGGTIGDIWTTEQIPFGLPFATFCGYAGPILGPVIGAYTPAIGFAWADWLSLIILAAALLITALAHPETYAPLLLEWRAKHLRALTGDDRYRAPHAVGSLASRLLTNVYRPFTMIWTEPIILVFSFYLVLLYFVLFAFLNGYPYIFQ